MAKHRALDAEPLSNWWKGTEASWERIPYDDRKELAFAATGCEVAWPRWQAPVACLHTDCRIRRGEILPIAKLNGTMRYETSNGWWRFIEDRTQLARMYRHYRREARRTGEYDLWKLGGAGVALLGVMAR
jgi:hypothetical protein